MSVYRAKFEREPVFYPIFFNTAAQSLCALHRLLAARQSPRVIMSDIAAAWTHLQRNLYSRAIDPLSGGELCQAARTVRLRDNNVRHSGHTAWA